MDALSQKTFDRIVKLKPYELSEEDIEFLWGRRDYLSEEQARKFQEVLDQRASQVQQLDNQDAEQTAEPTEEVRTKKSK